MVSENRERYSFVVVANRLPADRCEDDWCATPGGLAAALAPLVRTRGGAWIGWSGTCDEDFAPVDFEGIALVPLSLTTTEFTSYYEGFSNATLWPLYHDQVVAPQFRRSWWNSYKAINERFAEAVARTAAPGATVWIHDFQLQLVPGLVRQLRPDVSIGYFSHIPFPPAELFSQLPWRDEILGGLLGADVIGFQRESDVKNFSNVRARLAPADADAGSAADADAGPTPRIVGCYPSSIDVDAIERAVSSSEVAREAETFREDLGSPETLILGIDRLDHTKGIMERLLAYEELLDEGRLDPRRTCLVQIAVPSCEGVVAYQELRESVEQLVGRINGKFAKLTGAVVHYLRRSYTLESTIAFYLAADVLLVTSLRDGMNLTAKEYVTARKGRGGALVLSEFAGSADELTKALLINPHNLEGLKTAIAESVSMGSDEAAHRIDAMAEVVRAHDVHDWSASFLRDLESQTTHAPSPT